MKFLTLFFSLAFLCLSISLSWAQPSPNTFHCASRLNAVAGNTLDSIVNYGNGTTGTSIDPNWLSEPVLSVDFHAAAGCVLVDLSALGYIKDNHLVLQVQLDGQPLPGHGKPGYLSPGIQDRIISERDEFDATFLFIRNLRDQGIIQATNQQLQDAAALSIVGVHPRMLSYTFIGEVDSGEHTVSLFLGGCCGGGGTSLRNPTLIVQYQDTSKQGAITELDGSLIDNGAYLGPNSPNPAQAFTYIPYSLPYSTKQAYLLIYDLATGKQVDRQVISGRGSGRVQVFRRQAPVGLYGYLLIADGVIVGARKLVWE